MKSTIHELRPFVKELSVTGPFFDAYPRLVCTQIDALPTFNADDSPKFSRDTWAKVPTPLPFNDFSLEFNCNGFTRVFLLVCVEGHKAYITMAVEYKVQVQEKQMRTSFQGVNGEIVATKDSRWKVISVHPDTASSFNDFNISEEERMEKKLHLNTLFSTAVRALLSFVQVINSQNTELVTNKAGKVSIHKARKNKTAIPQDFFTVQIKPNTKKKNKVYQGGTHASPAPHARRSHIRRLASGVSIVIPPMLVNTHKGGATLQEYIF